MEATHITSNPESGKLGTLNKDDDVDDDDETDILGKQLFTCKTTNTRREKDYINRLSGKNMLDQSRLPLVTFRNNKLLPSGTGINVLGRCLLNVLNTLLMLIMCKTHFCRESVIVGMTDFSEQEIEEIVREMGSTFTGVSYHLVEK